MRGNKTASKKPDDLRSRAEEVLLDKTRDVQELSSRDIRSLVHELQVHQIELEMQNEELKRAQMELEDSRDRYSDLYDFAPVGYFTFDRNGLILEVNLTGACWLGVERSVLIKNQFYHYVAPQDKDEFYQHLRQVFNTCARQTCEVRLVNKYGVQFYAQLESIAVQDGRGKPSQCRTAIIDITERKKAEGELQRVHDELEKRVVERTAELTEANLALLTDIAERRLTEEALRESEEKFRSIIEQSGDGIVLTDEQGIIIEWNRGEEDIIGMKRAEVIGRPVWDVQFQVAPEERRTPENYERIKARVLELIRPGQSDSLNRLFETDIQRPDGTLRTIQVLIFLIKTNKGFKASCISRDITEHKQMDEKLHKARDELEIGVQERTAELGEANKALQVEVAVRKRSEEQLKESLKEKDVLLKEVHHRVKNNMQVISSLLNLQEDLSEDKKIIEILKDSQHRILSMALIHERLYKSGNLSKIDLKEYTEDLVSGLFESYGVSESRVALNINIENVLLGVDFAIPCGLVINELVSNSLKHAFPEGKSGEIKICLRLTDENIIELFVGDNGIGIPKDMDIRKTQSLGLYLVTLLVENQLHGEIILNRERGAEFQIKFRGPIAR